ncbi:MAG: hypothetical protein ABSC24_10935 [Verrucomicrobiota bacterium]
MSAIFAENNFCSVLRLGGLALDSAKKLLDFVVVTGHQKQQRPGAVLKYQPEVQANADFKKISRQPANAQSPVSVRMSEILFHLL